MWKRFIESVTGLLFRILAVFFPPVPAPLPKEPGLILVFSTTGIGDSLFDTAAVRGLRSAYPLARIIVCAHRRRSTIFRHDPDVSDVVPYGKSPVYAWRLITRFRRDRPDLVVLLNINPEVVPIAYCINRRAVFGGLWRCGDRSTLLSYPVEVPSGEHILRLGDAVSSAAGGVPGSFRMVYQPENKEISAVKSRFSEWIADPFVVFQTGGGRSRAWRDWPVDSYIRNIRWLAEKHGIRAVLTGGWDNESAAHRIAEACPGSINLCTKTTLEETAALLTLSTMLVSTDTGVLFLGYATGCPSLAILHYASPRALIGPLDTSVGHEVVELSSPDVPSTLLEGEMEAIRDEDVRSAIDRILTRRNSFST